MVLLPYWLNLDSLSLIRLATLILALAIFVYLLTLKNKSPSTVFLAFVFCGGLIFNAASLLEFAGAYYWRPRTLKNIVVPLLLDAGPSLALVALLLFAYHFPRFRSEEKKEFRIVLFISLFANTARLAFAGYDFLVLQRESRDFLLTEVY